MSCTLFCKEIIDKKILNIEASECYTHAHAHNSYVYMNEKRIFFLNYAKKVMPESKMTSHALYHKVLFMKLYAKPNNKHLIHSLPLERGCNSNILSRKHFLGVPGWLG